MTDLVANVAGEHFVPAAKPVMGGEDFSYYLERVPGCFFFIGLAPDGEADYPAAAHRSVRFQRRSDRDRREDDARRRGGVW